MPALSIREIGEKMAVAGRLMYRPLCVYGSDSIPEGAAPSSTIDRCVAKAIFTLASGEKVPPIYISAEDGDCCPSGRSWLGWGAMPPLIKYYVTVGTPEFRGGAAEHLKSSPGLFEKSREANGKITPPGRYVVVSPCSAIVNDPGVRSILLFCDGERIRNLSGLAYFNEHEPFSAVLTPSGPSCATFVTYPAGMAEKAPKNSVFTGPTDPTGNIWLPPELMAMGIPIEKAAEMAGSVEESYIGKRPKVAYPERRLELKTPPIRK